MYIYKKEVLTKPKLLDSVCAPIIDNETLQDLLLLYYLLWKPKELQTLTFILYQQINLRATH